MFKKITILALILPLLVFSCKKNETSSSAPVFTEQMGESASSSSWEMGYVLRVNSGLYTMDEDTGNETDLIKWVASLNLGDSVMVRETRKATYADSSGNKTVYDVIEVRDTTGREGYALLLQIAVGGKLAVITDERANLYKTPNTVDATGLALSRKTVMVFYPETTSNGFVEIRAYDPELRAYRHGNYIRLTSLSDHKSDIQSSILLQTALVLRDSVASEKARKEILLESALLDYPDSVFYADIAEIIYPPQADTQTDTQSDDEY